MDLDWVRRCCLSFPHATGIVQWECLVFKIGGKMFALAPFEPSGACLSFKCSPQEFAELIERPGIIPAPYLARAGWIALEREDALPPAEVKRMLRQAYELVLARLPKKAQAELGAPRAATAPPLRARRST
jgi:predicted DNA-binding protein (MmcQ/YjbR family)